VLTTLLKLFGADMVVLQAEEVVEDWELWGDPREVERRKADRARAAQPLHVRQAQVRQTSLQHIGIDAMFMCDK